MQRGSFKWLWIIQRRILEISHFFFLIIQYSTKWLGNIRDRRAIYVGASDLGPAHASEAFSLVSRVTHILAKCLLHRPLEHQFSFWNIRSPQNYLERTWYCS